MVSREPGRDRGRDRGRDQGRDRGRDRGRGRAAGPRSGRRHGSDAVSLVAGLVFCGIALAWLLLEVGAIGGEDLAWALPVLLIGSGVVGILTSRRRRDSPPPGS